MHVVRIRSSMSVEEHLSRTRGKRKILAHEKAVAEDVAQLLDFEQGFAQHQLETRGAGDGRDGRPSVAVLVASWRRARDSWLRVTKALPLDSALRNAMAIELQDRDEVMNSLAERASEMLKVAEDA
jgi:hypothetical protein